MMYAVPIFERALVLEGRHTARYLRNNTCITLAYKEQDRGPVGLLHGLRQGKPSGECACVTYCSTLTQGLTLVYDKKYSYSTIVRKLDLTSETCGSYIIKKLADSENPLWKVERLCFLLRLVFDTHTSFQQL